MKKKVKFEVEVEMNPDLAIFDRKIKKQLTDSFRNYLRSFSDSCQTGQGGYCNIFVTKVRQIDDKEKK